jgi:ABC-2 type transport system permease protein
VTHANVQGVRPHDEQFDAERAPFLWLVEREVLRFLNIWQYSIAGPVLSTILVVVVFGSALGQRVPPIDGVAYGQFIVRGLFAQTILTVGFVNGTTSLFEARRDKYINDVFASPLRWWEINAALVTGGVVRGTIVGAAVLAIALPITHITEVARPVVFVFGTVAVLLVAGQVGVIAGALARSLDHVYSMESIILLPPGFLGGVFYSVAELPRVWDVLSRLNPVFWLVQVERIGVLGHGDVGPATALIVMWALATALSVWSAASSARIDSRRERGVS